ncbi:carbamoyltransferase C-terminal domain-containing protein [Burkholderia pseudomallei]|uniref:carbamoyltransferase C-terminal domain-containing protein n=1 Tax=Burkholderia pseudomallei TaxID=28450 RepID=UPI0003D86E50|nr:carbamoyltransferase C-terminal domain-containing protein [Burkholderia pseudomallei]AHE29908.1 carbamoyltransferase family protein [Burkholderia pseudomallei NCTC 13178]KGC47231.1 carbamoyltransferase family protein [Burkholderia pseudomallei]
MAREIQVLGIHNGHHASCAVVRDGVVVAAIEQERFTRVKGDGADGLTDSLPIAACLRQANTSLDQIDLIVSSFQAMGPGAAGLQRPLAQTGFSLFNPRDPRHWVISHHLAHALCAFGTSGFKRAAALVLDLAGSTTRDGKDFAVPFTRFEELVKGLACAGDRTLTECLSIYVVDETEIVLCERDYCVPHNAPELFVCSVAALYDNVARAVFGKEDAHGQLMALAALPRCVDQEVCTTDIFDIDASGRVKLFNDWQYKVTCHPRDTDNAHLAATVQECTTELMVHYARKAKMLTSENHLVAAGGVFLNIIGNTAISQRVGLDAFHVPSAPNDAGIAVGCAFYGWRHMLAQRGQTATVKATPTRGRVAADFSADEANRALKERSAVLEWVPDIDVDDIAQLLRDGKIIARCAGRAEFGPRALGGRSLLASALAHDVKDRLNQIKGRQPWRPVAPIVRSEDVHLFFEGPVDSSYMSFAHTIRERHRAALVALLHPDNTTRVQTLQRADDPALHELLTKFGDMTGYAVLVNTSLNGPGEPIVQLPHEALEFFLAHDDVDAVLLGTTLVKRRCKVDIQSARLARDTLVTFLDPLHEGRAILIRDRRSMSVSGRTALILMGQIKTVTPHEQLEIERALRYGLLVTDGRL